MDTVPSPAQVAHRMLDALTSNSVDVDESLWAPDVVLETPFAPEGRSRRIEGRDAVLAMVREGRRTLPVRFDGGYRVVVHETADPEVVVLEYELAGTVTTTGVAASARFITVLTARGGQVVGWREYQDTTAMTAALGTDRGASG